MAEKAASAREAAYRLILRVEESAYSNIALDAEFRSSPLSERDKAFAARLFYGVCERKLTLDYIISRCVEKNADKLDKPVRIVLEQGIYQIMFMDSVPDSAAVNEAVSLIKKLKKASASGLVNAVLRRVIRDGKTIPEVKGSRYKKMSVMYSCPEELVKRICEGYGEDNARFLLETALEPSRTVLRTNTLKMTADELERSLNGRGISTERSEAFHDAVICSDLRDVENDPDFARGSFHVQDLSSQACCMAVDPQEGDTIIDICAAPGGKTFTMAEMMKSGRIYACELHEKRTGLIRSGAERLGIGFIEAVTNDARIHNDSLPMADRVLCDVPCSGYGVIRGKPEIRYKPLSDADRLPEIQLSILETASAYVKDGGVLVYSTCTVNIEENERVIERFFEKHSEFVPDTFPEIMGEYFKGKSMTAIFSKEYGGDGFFICRMRKA